MLRRLEQYASQTMMSKPSHAYEPQNNLLSILREGNRENRRRKVPMTCPSLLCPEVGQGN
jgi:hypothetical protein